MKKVKEVDWSQYGRPGRKARPYDMWFDGDIYLLEPGEDYNGKPESLASALRYEAKRRNITIKTAITPEGVLVQAIKEKK